MYNKNKPQKTTIKRNTSYEGETIEKKINRIVNNKEPIKDGAPLIYTERKEGVKPEYDIRTDRFEKAIDAMDYIAKTHIAKRDENAAKREKSLGEQAKEGQAKEDGGAMPGQATDPKI